MSRLRPDRAVGEVTRELLRGIRELAGEVEINTTPQEVAWTAPLDEDDEHASYDVEQVAALLRRGHAARRSCSPSSAPPTAGARRP